MRKIFLMIVISIFIAVNSVQATIINILDVGGTINAESLLGLAIYIGSMDQSALRPDTNRDFSPSDFNKLVRIFPGSGYSSQLTAMMERTFTPYMTISPTGDLIPDNTVETNYMWASNRLYGSVWFFRGDASGNFNGIDSSTQFNISPIPDLSAFKINDLYAYNNIIQTGTSVIYDIQLYANATPAPAPVPEPSTLLLLGGGLAGLAFWSKRRTTPKLFA